MEGELAGRSGVAYITGGDPTRSPDEGPAMTIGAVCFEEGGRARIHIYWTPVW